MEESKESRETRPREKITLDTVIPPMPSKTERLVPPDEDKLQRELKILDAKVNKLREQKKGFHDQIKVKKEGGKMDNQDTSVKEFIGTKLLSKKEMLNQRTKLRTELDIIKEEFYSMIEEQKKIRPKIKIFDKQKTEREIQSIQTRIETTTLSLQDEKKLISELSLLQYSLPLISQFLERSAKIDANKARQEVIKAELAVIKSELDKTSSLIEETNSKIKSSKDNLKQELPLLFAETKKIQEEIDKIEDERKILVDDFKEKKSAYQKQVNYIKQVEFITKTKARLIEQEERRKEQEEYEKQQELNKPHPYAKEITSCETFIAFLNKFIPKSEPESQKQEKKEVEQSFLPEKTLLNAKETEEWFGSHEKKPKKTKKNKKQKGTEGLLTSQPIDLLNFFSYCGIKVPTTIEEAKEAIKELETRKNKWESLDTREKEDNKDDDKDTYNKSVDLSFDPVNFPAPEESKAIQPYRIFKDEGPVPTPKEDFRGKRGKRRFK
jgi:hypothetical protein